MATLAAVQLAAALRHPVQGLGATSTTTLGTAPLLAWLQRHTLAKTQAAAASVVRQLVDAGMGGEQTLIDKGSIFPSRFRQIFQGLLKPHEQLDLAAPARTRRLRWRRHRGRVAITKSVGGLAPVYAWTELADDLLAPVPREFDGIERAGLISADHTQSPPLILAL